jgi:hypothetical protein
MFVHHTYALLSILRTLLQQRLLNLSLPKVLNRFKSDYDGLSRELQKFSHKYAVSLPSFLDKSFTVLT